MSPLDRINIDLIGIGRSMMNRKLRVPFYQRSYAWEDKHILDLFSDVEKAMAQNEPEYFLGSIVTTKVDADRPEVSDGQQRLATIAILLAAIRDYYYNTGNPDDDRRADNISITYLQSEDLVTLQAIPRLLLNDADNEFFQKSILAYPDSPERLIEPTKESHRKIARAAELAKNYVDEISKLPNPNERLAKLVAYVIDSVKVIWVSVSDDSKAFILFETLNDRGLALAISDLLKNFLFGLAADRVSEVQQRWMQMIGTLESIESEEIVVTYIRHLWSSKYGLTREKDLYSDIKNKIHNKSQAVQFATELQANSILYSAMLNPSHDIWQKFGPTARDHMNTLNQLRMIQIRPLVLSVLDNFPVKEVQKTLRLMVSWAVRFLIVGGLGGGTLENHYSQSAKEIRDHAIRSADELASKIKVIVPSDKIFMNAFDTASVSPSYLARYYLRALERQKRGEKAPELIPVDNPEVVNLEHILPLHPSSLWNHISEEDKAAYTKRIGNLALLKTRINTEAGNDTFNYKKQFYKQSEYILTSEVGQYDNWTIDEISIRQAELAKLAVKTWPLK